MIKNSSYVHTFVDSLKDLEAAASTGASITIREIFKALSGRGYAALLVLFSFPFCLPIQIPGFSTPFGLLLAFLGLRIAFAKRLWWPKWVLKRNVPAKSIKIVAEKAIKFFQSNIIICRPRLVFLATQPFFHRLNGVIVCVLGILLSIPLPIPFTNLLCAVPILCLGLGLLEDDGLFILFGYIGAVICVAAFIALFFFGTQIMTFF